MVKEATNHNTVTIATGAEFYFPGHKATNKNHTIDFVSGVLN